MYDKVSIEIMRKFLRYFLLFILICLLLLTAGFFIPRKWTDDKKCTADSSFFIIVGSNGYHTSFILPVKNDLHDWSKEFPVDNDIQYMEFGWGNQQFYMGRDFSLKATVKALFPSQTVMHVVYLDKDPEQWFKKSKAKRIHVCKEDYLFIVKYIQGSFEQQNLKKIYLGEGLYGPSSFYKGKGKYHTFETCNTWVAKGLRGADVKTPLWGGLAPAIMWHLRNKE